MKPPIQRPSGPAALACLMALTGCDAGTSTGPALAAVVVTSPIGEVMAAGRAVQLVATARDGAGDPIDAGGFVWESSDPAVASVSGGVVQGRAAGTATISARADGVSGSIDLRVVEADLETISILLDDSYTSRLVTALGAGARAQLQGDLDDCSTALADGNLLALEQCLGGIPQMAASEATDRALLAVLGIIAGRARLLLNL